MFCKKCGKELKEGNNFCTNCGKPVNEIVKNKKILEDKTEMKKDNKKIAIKIMPPIIVIIIIAIIVFLVFKMNKDENIESNVNNEISVDEKELTNSESENITVEEITSENLLDEIYAKYPKLKDTEGIICTDGESYWLLDENGEKVYFDSMESFEKAKKQCNLDVELLGNNEDVETNEETTTSTEPQESLSETGSTGSQNNNYNSQDTNKNTGPVTIAFNVRFENITGDKDIYCVLHENKKVQDPGEEGLQVYFDNKLVATVKQDDINYYGAKAFEYTFNNQDKVRVKLIAPFAYGAVNTSNEDMPYQKDVVIAEYDLNINDIKNNYYYLY